MMSRNNPKRFKSLPMPRNPACPLKMHCEMSSRELSVTMASLAVFGNVPRPLTDNLLYKSTSNSPTAVKLTLPFLAQSCDSEPCNEHIEALYAEHSINLIKNADGKELGERAGLVFSIAEGM